jgi:hypothetical protein
MPTSPSSGWSATTSEIQGHTFEEHPIEDETNKQTGSDRQWILYLRGSLKELPVIERLPRGISEIESQIDDLGFDSSISTQNAVRR